MVKKLWKVKKWKILLLNTQKKLSLVIVDNKIFFNNSVGDITAVDIDSGDLLWQTPTQSNTIYEENFFY